MMVPIMSGRTKVAADVPRRRAAIVAKARTDRCLRCLPRRGGVSDRGTLRKTSRGARPRHRSAMEDLAPVRPMQQPPERMGEDSTISSLSNGWPDAAMPSTQPYLVVLAICDDPRAPSSRHLLGGIDEVRFGRGARSVERVMIDGKRVLEVHVPDPRMSSR